MESQAFIGNENSCICESRRTRAGRPTIDETSSATLAQTPGPDLAYQGAVIESEAFISSENSCISIFRRTRAG